MTQNDFMLLALETSKKALPQCLPNPPVGCVIVRDGKVVATGYTHQPGCAHAEVDALAKLAGSLEGCEMYVTLEPCSFTGRTPSCAKEIIKRKVGRLYVSIIDPHVRNNGKGIEIIERATIPVSTGLCETEVSAFLSPYLNPSSPPST